MFLSHIEIAGFQGINRLAMDFHPNMVLIGENAWGKSSLLNALSLIFKPDGKLYQFTPADFHFNQQTQQTVTQITLLIIFSESSKKEHLRPYLADYQPVFVENEQNTKQIYLRIQGERLANQQVVTHYDFIDETGSKIYHIPTENLVKRLLEHFPVFYMRNAKLNDKTHLVDISHFQQKLKNDIIYKEISALSLLLQYYFLNVDAIKQITHYGENSEDLWEQVKSLCKRLKSGDNLLKRVLFELLTHLFKHNDNLSFHIEPMVLLEDPDARLHPRMVAIIWELTSYLPLRRLTTTNSVALLSQVELGAICRLVRYSNEIKTFYLQPNLLSKQDLRRLTFHIHYNRSLALFANVWLLVEGETEVWLLSALAEQLGYNLELEGIKIVEFAQCGLSPLLKYVQAMGIEWYVLTDGDVAGKKYSETVKRFLKQGEIEAMRLTQLPKLDIEHYLYSEGFRNVFVQLANWQAQNNNYPTNKIIQRAIKRSSKPDLALALAAEIEERGIKSIPALLQRLFQRVINLTSKG